MKRFHVHVSVDDLERNIAFYSALFGCEPTVRKNDYAKWMLDDPRVNFAISNRGAKPGVDHLGFQVGDAASLEALHAAYADADADASAVVAETGTACCYARSDKYWLTDLQGIAWEAFHTLDTIPTFNDGAADAAGCCTPATVAVPMPRPAQATRKSCC